MKVYHTPSGIAVLAEERWYRARDFSFDELLAVTDKQGAVVKGSWVLSDDARVLRFPHVDANKDYVVVVKAGVTAADGQRLGRDHERVHGQ